MPTAVTLLDRHVTLQCRSLDRLYLNAYVPRIQRSGGLAQFLEREGPIASPALLQRRSTRFVDALRAYCDAHEVPWVLFGRDERKEERLRPLFESAEERAAFGLVALGVAQERVSAFRARKITTPPGGVRFSFSRQAVYVNQYYLYIRDAEFGRSFIKFSSYAPWGGRLYLNGHEWAKRQLGKRGVRFRSLDNGFLSVADAGALAEVCAALGPNQISAYFARWSTALPLPIGPAERRDGYEYRLSMLQVEVADTRVFDRPLRGRQWFEAVIRDQLSLGRPSEVSLLFGRRISRRTPGTFRTKVIHLDTAPAIRIQYKRCAVKQYLKEGRALRTETTFDGPAEVDIGTSLRNLPRVVALGQEINARLLEHERASEEARLSGRDLAALVLPGRQDGRRIPALRFGDPRVSALLAALSQLGFEAAGFRHAQFRRSVAVLLGGEPEEYTRARATYDLARLRAHRLVSHAPRRHRYRLTADGLTVAAFLTKLNDRVLAPGLAHCTGERSPAPSPTWGRFDQLLDQLCRDAQLAA